MNLLLIDGYDRWLLLTLFPVLRLARGVVGGETGHQETVVRLTQELVGRRAFAFHDFELFPVSSTFDVGQRGLFVTGQFDEGLDHRLCRVGVDIVGGGGVVLC